MSSSVSTIAILGGGVSGLSAAFHLSRRYPQTPIVLFEKSRRVGGWIRSQRVEVKDSKGHSASICLEAGPRTLRPNSNALLELINLLGLTSALITTPKYSPAARNRFIYAPELGSGLVKLPASPFALLSTAVGRDHIIPAIWRDMRSPYNRNKANSQDEAFEAFLCRRFGSDFARLFGSAIIHGIYAADARELSVRTAFPSLWEAEQRGNGSVVIGFMRKGEASPSLSSDTPYLLDDVQETLKDASVYSFNDGLETIPRSLLYELQKNANVSVKLNTEITGIDCADDRQEIKITISSGETVSASHVVSSVSLSELQKFLSPMPELSALTDHGYSSVIVVNIVFAPSEDQLHPPGFGYLIPRPSTDYHEDSPGILGVVFDSCSLSDQDIGSAPFTKLTAMIGGPYSVSPSEYDDEKILRALSHHLGHRLPEPIYMYRTVNRDCIPHLNVGHKGRVDKLFKKLSGAPWDGRLVVIGPSIGGVSVGDCVEAGRACGQHWKA